MDNDVRNIQVLAEVSELKNCPKSTGKKVSVLYDLNDWSSYEKNTLNFFSLF